MVKCSILKMSPLLLAGTLLAPLACQKKDQASEADKSPSAEEAPRPTHSENTFSSPLMRLSPEQLSRTLERSLGFSLTWDGGDGRMVDGIVEHFALPLGGIDFENSSVRDPLAKVQTVLVARLIAWRGAEYVVWKDFERLDKGLDAELKLFVAPFHPWQDVPGRSEAGEKAWNAQLENIYWTLLSRAPTPEETSLHKAAFEQIMLEENAGIAWCASIYALLGGAEFWNLWGTSQVPKEGL